MDKDDCDGLEGEFTPGIRCEGGTCVNNSAYSCNDASDCPSGQCTGGAGGAAALAQPSPCPICSLESSSTCQFYDNPAAFKYSIADLSVGSGQIVADDFVATELLTSVEQVCVWGIYITTDPDDAAIAHEAKRQGVNVSPLSLQYRFAPRLKGLLFGFAAADAKATRRGIGRLAQVIGRAALTR